MFAITWQPSEVHGWGLVGVHTCLYLLEQQRPPMVLSPPLFSTMRAHIRKSLSTLPPAWEHWQTIKAARRDPLFQFSGLHIAHALGNNVRNSDLQLWGRRNIGVIAFEQTKFDGEMLCVLRKLDKVICHSRYNEVLLHEAGLHNVEMVWQGIDPAEMMPPPRRHPWGDRFVVFSGGKLEYRKGQDIALVAFRRFHERHPDAILVTAWHSPWPHLALTLAESRVAAVPPRVRDNAVQVSAWAADNGIPADSFVDLGLLPRSAIAEIMAETDVAIFPNRCEGGTNLVAMEAMACGVPTIVAANTGQLDLLDGEMCWPLTQQRPLADPDGSRRGWGESDPDELVEAMELVYCKDADVQNRCNRGRATMLGQRTWRSFAVNFVSACDL